MASSSSSSSLFFFSSFLLLVFFARFATGGVLFSSLKQTLIVQASPKSGEVLKAGEDQITVTWGLNQSSPAGVDGDYKTVEVKLCFAPISQVDRTWRKTKDDLANDKTCQFKIKVEPYQSKFEKSNISFSWVIERDIPSATYFVRAYALDVNGVEQGYGQSSSTRANETHDFFQIQGISGRHASLDIAAACFSAFSVVSLFGFFLAEKRKGRGSEIN